MAYNQKLEDWIDHFFISNENMAKKKQMGGVGWLVNGNMCCGIYEELLVVRVDPDNMNLMTQKTGIKPFAQDAENMNDFLSLSKEVYTLPEVRRKFLTHALKYTRSLPPKNDV
jgi:TfoX/Sxy family transcriptional regulator of competence genes